MRHLHLTPQQRFRLRQQLHDTHDAAVLRRTLALLHLDAGHSFSDIAAELRVNRRSVGRSCGRAQPTARREPTPEGDARGRQQGQEETGPSARVGVV